MKDHFVPFSDTLCILGRGILHDSDNLYVVIITLSRFAAVTLV